MEVDSKDVEMKKEDIAPDNAEGGTGGSNNDLNAGFAKHIEKEKVIKMFHSIAWPALFAAGWTKVSDSDVMPTDDDLFVQFFFSTAKNSSRPSLG